MGLIRCPEGHVFSPRKYGNVCPYCYKIARGDEENSLGNETSLEDLQTIYNRKLEVRQQTPLAGWLVCIDGPPKSMSWEILYGKNFLGRLDGMDIQILGDDRISKRNHTILIYDPKERKTVILPGETHGLVYVKGKIIYAPTELEPFDEIELGQSKFYFIPFCGDNFTWETGAAAKNDEPSAEDNEPGAKEDDEPDVEDYNLDIEDDE